MSALEIIFFLIFAYYGIRALFRMLLPMLFQGLVNKAQQSQQNYQQPNQQQQQRRSEGTVRVDKIVKPKSSIPDSEGDYIDYEEV